VGPTFTKPITCGQQGCKQMFLFSLAFKRHIENKHKVQCNELDNEIDQGESEVDPFLADTNPNDVPLDTIMHPPSASHILSKDEVTALAASTVAKLKSSSSVAQSTIYHVISDSSDLFSNVILSLKTKTEQLLDSKGINEDDPGRQDLLETFSSYEHPFEKLETAYKQQKYFTKRGQFITPREVPFADAYLPRYNPETGHVDQVAKRITFQYIPIKQLLKNILESRGFMRAILEYHPSTDGIMQDFHDGEFSQRHLFFSDSRNIGLLLYVDDCEIVNPLGSKAGIHRVGVIYCTILNIPPKFRLSVCNCFLVALYNTDDAKTHRFDCILKPLVEDIRVGKPGNEH
jgi:hypothetical protein